MQSEFATKGLGPRDQASVTLSVKRAEGGAPKAAPVTVIATVDDKEIHREDSKLSDSGELTASFTLPEVIEKGDSGTVTFKITDGGNVETHSKTIPILCAKVDVEFYPESGQLVAGLPCVLYVQAWTPWGDPADISAELISTSDASLSYLGAGVELPEPEEVEYDSWKFQYVAEFSTVHEGRGKVQFTPDTNKRYYLRVLKPSGVAKLIPLPKDACAIQEQGMLVRPTKTRFTKGEPIELELFTTCTLFTLNSIEITI